MHGASKLSSRSSSTAYTASSSPSTTSSGTSTTKRKVHDSRPLQTLQRRTTGVSTVCAARAPRAVPVRVSPARVFRVRVRVTVRVSPEQPRGSGRVRRFSAVCLPKSSQGTATHDTERAS